MSYAGIFTDKNNVDHPVTSTLYGTCDTAAATAAKVVTCADVDVLTSGMTIRVKFTNANTAASPTINVNSTGAKTVYRFGTTAPVDGDSWKAGEVVELLYDGTYFYMVSADDIGSKQDTLTFDNAPTSESTNPVTSGGVFTALADKADNDIIAAEFDSTANYVVGNYCIYQGGLYKFKANHTGAWAAADVDAITIAGELTAKQPKTDNNLTTTSKDTTGAINELKSGLANQEAYIAQPVKIGKWYNGKDIYRKVIYFGALPNASSASVDSGITPTAIINMYGVATHSPYTTICMPNVNIELVYDYPNNKVTINTTTDKSRSIGIVVVEYTID